LQHLDHADRKGFCAGRSPTDNGRDLFGDDFPPCERDRIEKGGFYGWPTANGNRVPDPDLGKGQEAQIVASIPPGPRLPRPQRPARDHVPARRGVPTAYSGAAVVAFHGSWNRTRKDGYKVVSLHWGSDRTIAEKDFLAGFLGATDDDVNR
jgi:glucose/arabinose dehydrogenase